MNIEPTARQIAEFQASAGDESQPVYMLNLLRFKETAGGIHADAGISGEAAYARYGAVVAAHLQRVGAEIVWIGRCDDPLIGPEREWDAAAVVRYPSRAAFLDMVSDPEYQRDSEHRAAALADSRLIPSLPVAQSGG